MKTAGAKRLGVIVPSSNTSMEKQLGWILPSAISIHAGRLPQTEGVGLDSVRAMAGEIVSQARLVATAAVDLILVAATVPTLVNGLGWDRTLIRLIEDDTGVSATTSATETVAALRSVAARRVVLCTPFIEEMNEPIVRFLEASGFEVLASHGLGIADNIRIGKLSPSSALEAARQVDRDDADTIVFVCTNWGIMAEIPVIERILSKPVIDTTQASLRGALAALCWPLRGAGPGALFDRPPTRPKAL